MHKSKMVNTKINTTRLVILAVCFMFFTYGGHFLGNNKSVILPIFNCEYVGGGTTTGLCIVLIDFNKYLSSNVLPFAFSLFMCLALMVAFGRLWCGYVCPMGFFQDIMTIVRQKFKIPQLTISQKILPFVTVFKWYAVFYILFNDLCKVCPIQYFTVPAGGYVSGPSGGWAYYWAVLVVAIATLSDRAVCRVCPIGTLIGVVNKISGARIKKVGSACTHCRACLEACPMDIQAIYEDRENDDVTYPECLMCMKCIEVCPEKGALRFELFGRTILESKRELEIKLGPQILDPALDPELNGYHEDDEEVLQDGTAN